jgi:hypothetical protein
MGCFNYLRLQKNYQCFHWSGTKCNSQTLQNKFLYSGNSDDLKKSKCHFPLIDTCPEHPEFPMPDGVRLSKNDIVSLCTSGLMSPYRAIKMYANVFCHICNGEYYSSFLFCRKLPEYNTKGANSKGFTALIDTNFIDELNDNSIVKEETIPEACFLDNVR